MDQAIQLLDEVIGFAKANAEAAATKDEQMTWAAHHRNCVKVRNYLTNRPTSKPLNIAIEDTPLA